MSRTAIVGTTVFALLVGPGIPARAQGVGAIGGTITDSSNAVLPGVTVVLSSPGTIGGNQETVTSERGTFLFSRLVPGRYIVRADLSGFRPAVQENIIVNADITARVDLQLEVGLVREAITVTGTPPLLDTTSALKQTVLSAETLQTLPGGRQVRYRWDANGNLLGLMPPGLPFALHHHMLTQMGIHHIENAKLDELARDKVWTSCTMVLPMLEKGSAGSPIRPVSIGMPARN